MFRNEKWSYALDFLFRKELKNHICTFKSFLPTFWASQILRQNDCYNMVIVSFQAIRKGVKKLFGVIKIFLGEICISLTPEQTIMSIAPELMF